MATSELSRHVDVQLKGATATQPRPRLLSGTRPGKRTHARMVSLQTNDGQTVEAEMGPQHLSVLQAVLAGAKFTTQEVAEEDCLDEHAEGVLRDCQDQVGFSS